MSGEKQIDVIIDLLTEFDEMGFVPTTTVPDPDAYAIEWKNKLIDALKGYRKQSEPISCGHQKGGDWISVDERLPEQYGLFLIADDKGNMEVASWTKQFGWFSGGNRVKRVTHWMPMPEPPKGV